MTSHIVRLHDDFWDGFQPDHRADLLKSGLSVATVKAAGIYSARPRDIPKLLGYNPKSVESALVFPYPNDPSFCRIKVFPIPTAPHAPRYLQRKQSGVRLYLPPLAAEVLSDPDIPLAWTEGEKKALKACQEGLPCGALGGLWNWIEDNRGVAGLEEIAHVNRHEPFYPDADVWARPDLLKAVYAFLRELEARGAQPLAVRMPMTAGVQKLDEFLVQRTLQDLHTLQQLPRQHKVFTSLARWWQGWRAKKLGTKPAPPTTRAERWKARLSTTQDGTPRETLGNVMLALQHLDPWANGCWYDEVRNLPMLDQEPVEQAQVTAAGLAIERQVKIPVRSRRLIEDALTYLCSQTPRDLLREAIDALPDWDEQPRLTSWLQTYAHAVDDAYSQEVSRLIPVSMIARALDPGCQYRSVVILEGPENAGKSKLVRVLATPEWYRELTQGLEGKEAHMHLRCAWVVELAELSSFGKTAEARLKAFFTMNEDIYIPKYSNFETQHKRRAIFIGTQNPEGDNTYMRSQTGNTRYLPIAVRDIDVEGVEAMRPQLLAEALKSYRAHLDDWWQLSSAGEAIAEEVREDRRVRAVYEDELADWLERTHKTVTWWEQIAEEWLALPKDKWIDRRPQMEAAKALKALGWYKDKRQRLAPGARQRARLLIPWRPGDDWHLTE